MHNAIESLRVGLIIHQQPMFKDEVPTDKSMLLAITLWSAKLVEGSKFERDAARESIKTAIALGRRQLNAADERKKAAAAPKAICGNAATGTPCEETNIRDCAGCMVGNFLSECEA